MVKPRVHRADILQPQENQASRSKSPQAVRWPGTRQGATPIHADLLHQKREPQVVMTTVGNSTREALSLWG